MPSTEHHSNLVPWTQTGQAVVFDCDPRQQLPPERLEAEIKRHRAKLVALCFVSNVTGVMQDVPELCARARALGAVTVVDASQAVAHIPIDVVALNADFVAFSGHKMLGPSGIGVLWGRREILEKVAPLTVGGGSVAEVTVEGYTLAKLPERLEAGTPNITGVIGLAAAIDYIESLGWEPLRTHEAELAACLEAELAATPKIRPLMAHGPARIALGSFTLEDGSLTVDRLSSILSDTDNIMVRSGFHCAHPLFAREGGGGGLRVSAYIYNSKHDIATFGEALRRILHRFTA
jgi:cysteine desulfurase/selenocysteine lyase